MHQNPVSLLSSPPIESCKQKNKGESRVSDPAHTHMNYGLKYVHFEEILDETVLIDIICSSDDDNEKPQRNRFERHLWTLQYSLCLNDHLLRRKEIFIR
jgi:hypothetical protein